MIFGCIPRFLVTALIIWLLVSVSPAADPVPLINVDGDAELLKLLHSVQVTNLTRYPRGEMTVKLHSERGVPGIDADLQAKIKWDGNKTYWDYKLDYQRLQAGKKKPSPGDHIQLILTPEGRYRLLSKNKVFQEMKDSKRAIEKELFVRPNQCWYSAKESRPFADFFDSRVFSNERFKFQLRQTGDEVELRRRDDISKHTLVMRFSLELDGNLTSYELTPDKPAEGQTTSRTFEWARLPDKQLYVTKIHQETRQGRQSPAALAYLRLKFEDARGKDFKPDITIFDKPTEILTIEFKNFNPNPHWTTDPFDPTLWKIDPRVMVEKHDGANVQRYRYGNQKTTNTEALDKLADELASQGFGVP